MKKLLGPLREYQPLHGDYNPRLVFTLGNQQHHPDKPLCWDRTKSTDHLDCAGRYLIDAGTFDTDNIRHSAKLAWRALANLELELEAVESSDVEYNLARTALGLD